MNLAKSFFAATAFVSLLISGLASSSAFADIQPAFRVRRTRGELQNSELLLFRRGSDWIIKKARAGKVDILSSRAQPRVNYALLFDDLKRQVNEISRQSSGAKDCPVIEMRVEIFESPRRQIVLCPSLARDRQLAQRLESTLNQIADN